MTPESEAPSSSPLPVVVVGAGPTGLAAALALAEHGVRSVVLDDDVSFVTSGSRSICVQGHTLAVLERLGVGAVAREGVQWTVGRTYHRERQVVLNRIPAAGAGHLPRFVNLPQRRVEELLVDAVGVSAHAELAWSNRVVGVEPRKGAVVVHSIGPAGTPRETLASYVIGADGGRSTVRECLGVPFRAPAGQPDQSDEFLIVDVRAELPFPSERRFYFDPPWNPGRQVLIHPQPDQVWRIDWQVPSGFDLEGERASGGLDRRVRAVIGATAPYEVCWSSVYTFRQRLADRFRAGRVFLAGDAAHTMSVFGARGMNSGIQDADNLGWKIAYALRGDGGEELLDSYETERRAAAVENLAVTGATMRFMAPPTAGARVRRRIVLAGAPYVGWLRRRVDSGRLSEPATYRESTVVQPGCGALAPDLPVRVLDAPSATGLVPLRSLRGSSFVVVAIGPTVDEAASLGQAVRAEMIILETGRDGGTRLPPYRIVAGAASEATSEADTAGAALGNLLIVRPDGHLAWKINGEPAPGEVAVDLDRALRRAAGLPPSTADDVR